MINISDVVSEIVNEDPVALSALQQGFINLSGYARLIKKDVEKESMKEVDTKSIVVALSRLAKAQEKNEPDVDIKILNLSVHSDLEEISFERTKKNLDRVKEMFKVIPTDSDTFFTATQGITEITLIGKREIIKNAKKIFTGEKPIFNQADLSGITVKFPIEYLKYPNIMFRITQKLAIKRINLIEIVSTTTELTFIIKKKYTEEAVSQLSRLL